MRRTRRALAMLVVALVATIAGVVVPATAASAAPPIDTQIPSTWAKWTFHAGGNYNLVIDAERSGGHGAPAQLYGDTGGSNQLWFQETASEGGQYLHPGYNRWLCLGRTGSGWGAGVVVQNCNASASQRWSITRLRYEYYLLKPYNNSGMCVDVPSSDFSQGMNLQLWGCNESSAQYWRMGHCWAAACDNQWPDVTDCDTSGADEVQDVTHGASRIVLVRATGCHAFYARMRFDGTQFGYLVLKRHHPAGDSQVLAIGMNRGETRWSPMLGVDQSGATFEACFESRATPYENFCTNLWWV